MTNIGEVRQMLFELDRTAYINKYITKHEIEVIDKVVNGNYEYAELDRQCLEIKIDKLYHKWWNLKNVYNIINQGL